MEFDPRDYVVVAVNSSDETEPATVIRSCVHGSLIPQYSRARVRAPECLNCHAKFLEDAAKRSAKYRSSLSEEEHEAWAAYRREWNRNNLARNALRKRLWRAERRLLAALDKGDEAEIQKFRMQLALVDELIHVFGAW